jgi:hypothetical protein
MIFGTSFESKFDDVAPVTDFKTYSLDAILARLPRVNYQLDAYLVAWPIHTYFASGRIGIPSPSYLADAIIAVDQADPRLSDSFINVLYWAFANEYRLAAQAIDLLELRMKLDFANTTDLDEYWGKLLGLRRKANELDTSYRARLATRI